MRSTLPTWPLFSLSLKDTHTQSICVCLSHSLRLSWLLWLAACRTNYVGYEFTAAAYAERKIVHEQVPDRKQIVAIKKVNPNPNPNPNPILTPSLTLTPTPTLTLTLTLISTPTLTLTLTQIRTRTRTRTRTLALTLTLTLALALALALTLTPGHLPLALRRGAGAAGRPPAGAGHRRAAAPLRQRAPRPAQPRGAPAPRASRPRFLPGRASPMFRSHHP